MATPSRIILHASGAGYALDDCEQRISGMGSVAASHSVRIGEQLLRVGEPPTGIEVIVSGFGCRYSLLPNGQRQITALLLPGDVVGFESLMQWACTDTVCALTTLQSVQIPANKVVGWIERRCELGRMLWQIRERQAAIYREWMINVAVRPALERITHFFCEVMTRSQALGIGTMQRCSLPMTQVELGDLVALTPVHVNRILKQLNRADLVTFKRGLLETADYTSLCRLCGFDSRYLDIMTEEAAGGGLQTGPLSALCER